jgi:ribonucleoside-diphosphate reductase alpha chain
MELHKTATELQERSVPEVPMQVASTDIWDKKYRLKAKDGTILDETMDDTRQRVARKLANLEKKDKGDWFARFLWALRHGATLGGRVMSNAGAEEHKPQTSTTNCTVSDTIPDSMDGILAAVHSGGLTLQRGAGIGYDFSTIRPKGAWVKGAGAVTSGVLSFMDIFDKMCNTVSSAGGRRGAQMGCLDVSHPEVEDFIVAKREDGRLRNFNLSLLITKDFINQVETDGDWKLVFPLKKGEAEANHIELSDSEKVVWRRWPLTDGYITNEAGQVACMVYKTVRAKDLWDQIMRSTYDFSDPGFLLIDEVNEQNHLWWCEQIRASNPCGEQMLPPGGACLLGSVDLTKFVVDPFQETARFDWEKFRLVCSILTRMLDNVVEINGLPLEVQQKEIIRKRRHGMGFMGLGSALAMLRIRYGAPMAQGFATRVAEEMTIAGLEAGVALAREKGPAPIFNEEVEVTQEMMNLRPEMKHFGIKVGTTVPARVLYAKFSRLYQRMKEHEKYRVGLLKEIEAVGLRFTHQTSIAPTGTIALSFGNNVSNGIEPSFQHCYIRNVIREGQKTKEPVEVLSYEFHAFKTLMDPKATADNLPPYFVTADSVTPEEHVAMQAAVQPWIDSAISKTVNVPTDFPFDKFQSLYLLAARKGLKGCTTFRFNPAAHNGVLVKKEDLEATSYAFHLVDGTNVVAKGTAKIAYDGALHNAANLFEAIKEGTYGAYQDRPAPAGAETIIGAKIDHVSLPSVTEKTNVRPNGSLDEVDPLTKRIDSRPVGELDASILKVVFNTVEGPKSVYLNVGFIPVEGVKNGTPVVIERPLEVFLPAGQVTGDHQLVSALMRQLSLAARAGFLAKSLADLRKVSWDRGVVTCGRLASGRPREFKSEVDCIAWNLQQMLARRGFLDESGNALPVEELARRYAARQANQSLAPSTSDVKVTAPAAHAAATAVASAIVGTCPQDGCGGNLVLTGSCPVCDTCSYSKCG